MVRVSNVLVINIVTPVVGVLGDLNLPTYTSLLLIISLFSFSLLL